MRTTSAMHAPPVNAKHGSSVVATPCFRALAIREKALGPDHVNVALRLESLAALLRATKRGAEAEALERRAAKIRVVKIRVVKR